MLFFKTVIPRAALAVLWILALVAGSVHADEALAEASLTHRQEEAGNEALPSDGSRSPSEVLAFPSSALYAPYLADPNRIGYAFRVLRYTKTRIPHSSDTRFFLKSGGQFGLVRVHPRGAEDLGWQLSLEGAFLSQFDIKTNLDNIGWDGRYGLVATTAQSKNLSMRFGYLHDSSHVGDEYEERNGGRRIEYTREELAAGISWLSDRGWRTYAEYGHAMVMGNVNQKPGRVQMGAEWQPPKPGPRPYRGWYAAADLTAMEERDWRIDVALQTGYRIDSGSKTWRFGVDWYRGRPVIGEFFQYTESSLGFGLWVDM